MSDVVLVDNALNESMLSPSSKMQINSKEKSNDQEVSPTQARPNTDNSSNLNGQETTEETEADPLDKVTTEEPGNLNGAINNTATELQSSVDLEVDKLELHGNSGTGTTVRMKIL